MIVKCPIHGLKYERFDFDKYATEDCPRCLSDRKHNSEFTYEEGVRSDNRLVLLFLAIILVFFLGMAFVSALETRGGIYNWDMEYGTGSTTTNGGCVGGCNYQWKLTRTNNSTGIYADYNSVLKHSGNQSLYFKGITPYSNLVGIGSTIYPNTTLSVSSLNKVTPIKPNTSYKLSGWVYALDLNNSEIYIYGTEYNNSGTRSSSRSSNRITSITNEWEYVSVTFSTNSTSSYLAIQCAGVSPTVAGSVAGHCDDIRLEEVDTVSLTTQQQGRPSLTITGVTDTNAIDQSQTTASANAFVGSSSGTYRDVFQIFKPTESKFTGITLYKLSTAGTPTGNLVIELRDVNATGYPTSTVFASKTFTLSEWNAYPNGNVFIPLPAIIIPDKNYAIYARDSNTSEASSNNYNISYNTSGGYSNGYLGIYVNSTNYTLFSASDLYFYTHFAKHSSSVDLNVVAPDGTSELKSYDVNGDILTDANITINPDGTGRYYYFADPTQSNGFQTTDVWVNDIYQSSLGGGATYLGINGWTKTSLNGGKIYTANDAGATERYLTWKIKAPNNCNFSDINTMISSISLSGELGSRVLQYSFDNSTWVNTDINFNEYDGALITKSDNFNIDGNNVVYLRFWKNNKGYLQFLNLTIDANMSCPSLTTPLFKSGTNTVYTMNKDADNQAGATLTPSLMSNINFSFTAPTTTFSSFQVPNTTDQNITLTCTSTETGCKAINYNINNTGWKDKTNHDLNYFIQNHTSYGKGITSTAFTSSVPFQFLQTISGSIGQAPGSGPAHPVYVKFNIYYRDGTTVETPTYGGLYSTSFSYTATKDYKDINYITSTTSGDNFYIQNLNADLNIYYNNPSRISFLYSGAGSHSIQYFSTDNSDNTETIKTSTFTTYGNIRFNMYDENTGTALTGVTINNGTTDYSTGANYYYDFNLQGTTTQTKTYTISKTGYSTRTYTLDQNQFLDLNINFALLPNTVDVDIPFKVYQTDETTLFINTFVELKDKDTNYTVGRLKTNSSGEATFNIRTDDPNYYVFVDNGAYVYSPVALTILYPKDEETLAQITEKWKIEISQNLYAYYPDLNTTKIVYLLPNTALPYNIKIGDMNGNYFQRTYSKLYPGNPLTDTLQPYLVKTTTGLLTTITTKNAITNTNISGITIKIYKFTPGQGRTLVEQVTTDNKGQAISLLVLGAEYDFECYSGTTFIKTYTITATSSTIFIYLQPTTETPETSPSGFAVKYTPTYSGLNKLNVGTQVFTQTGFNNYGVSVTYTSQIIQGTVLSSQSYTGSDANKTFSHTINWVDINNDVPVISRLTITYGGKNYVYQTNYIVNDSFGTNYNLLEGLSTGLRSDAGCEATGICFPLMTIALLLSIGLTIWVAISMGQLGQQTAGIVLLLAMVIFTYLSWIPFELTVACVLILLAFVVNERRN